MKTSEFIAVMAADAARGRSPARTLGLALLPALVLALLGYVVLLGPRADLGTAFVTPRFGFKLLASVALLVTAAGAVLRLASPGRRAAGWWVALALVPTVLLLGVVVELLVQPRDSWHALWIGRNSTWCLRAIPSLALAPLVATLLALRHAAPTRPVLAGAAAGLLAGGLGATIYATHCPDDSPLFVATWYVLAVALVTTAGALAGRRLLRW